MNPLFYYLLKNKLPCSNTKSHKIQLKAKYNLITNAFLYQKLAAWPNLKYLPPKQAELVMSKIHEGEGINHSRAQSLPTKL